MAPGGSGRGGAHWSQGPDTEEDEMSVESEHTIRDYLDALLHGGDFAAYFSDDDGDRRAGPRPGGGP